MIAELPLHGKLLAVCSGGGHLVELRQFLASRSAPMMWSTSGTGGPPGAIPFPYIKAKDLAACLRAVPAAQRILRHHRPDSIVSTGAAIAIPFAVAAKLSGTPMYFIESAARRDHLSATGSLLRRLRLAEVAAQFPMPGVGQVKGVFADFEPQGLLLPSVAPPLQQVVVTLGTSSDWFFKAAVDKLISALGPITDESTSILWQVGRAGLDLLGRASRAVMPESELRLAMEGADVVIGHAGVGTALMALNAGKVPVLLPRRAGRAEHTDDHQQQLADFLSSQGLAVAVEADDLETHHILSAVGASVSAKRQSL